MAGAVAAVKPIFSGIVSVFDTIRGAVSSVRESLSGVFGEASGGAGILQTIGKAVGFLVTTFNPFVLVLRLAVFVLKVLGNIAAGVIHLPALGETVAAARGAGCFWNGSRTRVSTTSSLSDAMLSRSEYGTTPPDLLAKLHE